MKITKYPQSCLLVETNNKKILIDAGGLKYQDKFLDYLQKDNNGNTHVTTSDNGKKAILNYAVIEEKGNYSLVDVSLVTGRHHQIRVQFASRGYPLVGDNRYGKLESIDICLCSYKLSFFHPITKEKLTFTRMPNVNKMWGLFNIFNQKSNK